MGGKSVQKLSEEKQRWLKENYKPEEKEHPSELPHWVKIALTRRVVQNLSYKDAAAQVNRNSTSLARYARSPAAKAWLASLEGFVDDPLTLARFVMEEAATEVTMDRFMALEAAKANGDWNLVDRIARDLQDRMGIVAKKEAAAPIELKITFGGGTSLDVPVVEADWTAVEDEEGDD